MVQVAAAAVVVGLWFAQSESQGGIGRASRSTAILVLLLLAGAVSNVLVGGVGRWPGLVPTGGPSARVMGTLALFDVGLLTGLLSLTGGPTNPFSVLYLIYVMLAAIATTPRWTWSTVLASSAGFGLVFFVSVPLPAPLGGHTGAAEGHPYAAHLQGMWLALTVAAIVIARWVGGLAEVLRREQQMRAQTSKMLGLATLAAGAAHEIGNPLATIRVAASELERDLQRAGGDPEIVRDLALIGQEVERAHQVLEHMSVAAGELRGEGAVPTDLKSLLQDIVAQLGGSSDRIELSVMPPGLVVRWPTQAATQALTQLVRNAVQAAPSHESVALSARELDSGVAITVSDSGPGIEPEVLARLGEPFFTTRPGRGRGLGVFIARSLVEHLGGQVEVDSAVGKGTVVKLWLPTEVA